MQKALESFFGPELLGLLGLAFMLIMFVPKLVHHWRGKQSQKKDPNTRPKILGLRAMKAEPTPDAAQIENHPDHGEALAILRADLKTIFLESFLWILPIILVLLIAPQGERSLFICLMVTTVILACIGLFNLLHLGDRAVFYRTGVILRVRFHKQSIDYNTICSIKKRKPLFPWMAPSYILFLEDDKLAILDGTSYIDGRKQLKLLLDSLDARVIRSAADETKRTG